MHTPPTRLCCVPYVTFTQSLSSSEAHFFAELPVQYHRFDIFEDLGCYPAISSSTLTYFTSFLWPLALGMVASVYSCKFSFINLATRSDIASVLTLVSFNGSRMHFAQIIATSAPTLTISRYLRTMALAMVLMIFASALAILNIVLNATKSDRYAWRTTNSSYRQVEAIPSAIWRQNSSFTISAELTRWFAPICALVFISLFGFAEEAREKYRLAIVSVTGRDAKSSDVELEDRCVVFDFSAYCAQLSSLQCQVIPHTCRLFGQENPECFSKVISIDPYSNRPFNERATSERRRAAPILHLYIDSVPSGSAYRREPCCATISPRNRQL